MSRSPSAFLNTHVKATSQGAQLPYFLLLLLVVSLVLMKNWDMPIVHRKLQVSDLVFMAVISSALILSWNTFWRPVPLGFGFPAAFALGLIPSLVFARSLGQNSIQYLGLLSLVALYWVVHRLVTKEERWWGVVRVWFWTTLGVVALAWVGWGLKSFFGLPNPFLSDHSRLYGDTHPLLTTRLLSTFHHPAMLAAYLNASLAPAFLHARSRRWSTTRVGALFAVVVLTAAMTKARVAAGVVVSAALIWMWCVPGASRLSRRILGGLATVMGLLALVTSFWWVVPLKPSAGAGGLPVAFNRDHTPYYYFHSAALRIGLDHPWTGVGLEQYNSHMVGYIDWEEAKSGFRWTDPNLTLQYRKPMDPHSTYLSYWAEGGLPGVLGLGVFLGGLLWLFLRGTRLSGGLIPSTFLAVLLGFLLNGYYLDITTLRFFWAVMALGTVALNLDPKTP